MSGTQADIQRDLGDNNLDVANQGTVFLLIVAFPFDNALFHFSTLFLLLAIGLTISVTRWEAVKASVLKIRQIHFAFIAILLVMVISNLLNLQAWEAWRNLLQFAARYWLLLTALYYLMYLKLLPVRVIFVATLVSISFQVLPFYQSIWDGSIFSTRFAGFAHSPNVLGFHTALGLMLCLQMSVSRSLHWMVRFSIPLLLGAVFLAVLIATGSRGSWVAFAATAFAFFVYHGWQRPVGVLPMALVIAGVGSYVLLQFQMPAHRLALLLKAYPALRDQVWQNVLTRFLEQPIWGFGLDTRSVMLEKHFIYSEHNIILSILLSLGVAGLLAYGFLVFRIILLALKYRDWFPLMLMGLMFIAGMFAFDFYRNQAFMIPFILVACACLQSTLDDNRRL